MTGSWMTRYFAEFLGTAVFIVFGNGSVANSFLKKTTANGKDGQANGGWIFIALGFGFGVMIPAMMFGSISGNHINPAITIAKAAAGVFPWSHVAQYIIAQMLGAIVGQLLVVVIYWPYFRETTNGEGQIFSCFATGETLNNKLNGFIAEFIGTAILVFTCTGIYSCVFFKQSVDIANVGVGFIIMALVIADGGPTGPALNPARDLGPRIVHAILPIPNKGSSNWDYSWVPVIAPILGALVGIFIYKLCFKI
ncbi:Glycerol uptake facilitator protein [Lactobacillus sp. wkB8]|uniref:MIP/aquaporin family protein n=1 Tax=Lactobacillus sp. wkB8 TaxID=1545702 RepID=UPI00050D550C|nr:MIP/aquaporin family protein [Lactobacillus sp. wkB8]AIS08422.1 Glycerol uptake facilitator protein [Lactobacillus sp. wkB8]